MFDTNPTTNSGDRTVIVAVHPDSADVEAAIARGQALSTEHAARLTLFTVITQPQVEHMLRRLHPRLANCSPAAHVVATRIDADGLAPAARRQRIAAEIADAAERLHAPAVVIGHDPASEPDRGGMLEWLSQLLPAGTELCLGVSGISGLATVTRPDAYHRAAADLRSVHLTEEGRRLLAARRRHLERNGLPRARLQLRRRNATPDRLLDYERQLNELRTLSHLIAHAPPTDQLDDDPKRVDLGERVELMLESGGRRAVVVVDPIEVARGRACVAADSGLGRALLGRHVGDWVTIPTPRGPRQARILSAVR